MHDIDKNKLPDQTKFRLYEIKKLKIILSMRLMKQNYAAKKLNKYVTIFNYINKILVVLSATTGGVSIISFSSVIGAPTGIASAGFTLFFSLTTRIVKKLLDVTRNKKKKHDEILMFSKSKFNGIGT